MRPVEMPGTGKNKDSNLDYYIQTLADAIIRQSANGDTLFAERLDYVFTTLALEVTNRKFDHHRHWVMALTMSMYRKIADEFNPRVSYPSAD